MRRKIAGYFVVTVAILLVSVSVDFARQDPGVAETAQALVQEAPANYRSPGNRHKLSVADRALSLAVEHKGGRLIADYGSYRVYEVDTAASRELTQEGMIEY